MYARMYVYNLMFLYGLLHYVTLHDIALRVLIASYVLLQNAALYHITLHFLMLYHIVLHSSILYDSIWFY